MHNNMIFTFWFYHFSICTHLLILTDVENQDPTTKGTSCSNGRFNLVRIGKPERIHSELSHLSLDYQAKKLLAKS